MQGLVSQVFGELFVIGPTEERSSDGRILWECRCSCGETTLSDSKTLKRGHKKTCGGPAHSRATDETGNQYGRLTVVERVENTSSGNARWRCQCDCGTETTVTGKALRQGNTTSCGCAQREAAVESNIARTGERHVENRRVDHPHYSRWKGMLSRCYNPNVEGFNRYGGRGIEVCDEWREDFWAFADHLDDVLGPKPEGWSLDRTNNELGYTSWNTRWASPVLQASNTRRNYRQPETKEKGLD